MFAETQTQMRANVKHTFELACAKAGYSIWLKKINIYI